MTLEQLDFFRMEVARHALNSFNFAHPNFEYNEKIMENWKNEGDTLSLSLPVKKYNKSNNTFYKDDNVVFYVDFKNGDFHLSNEEGGIQACLESTGERIGSTKPKFHEEIKNIYTKLDNQYLEDISKDIAPKTTEKFNIKF
jgi:hypothetical protein